MVELELTRAPDDRRVYELGAVGSLRLNGWLMRSATGRAGRRSFLFKRAIWSSGVDATDDQARLVGTFRPSQLRRGGVVRWNEAEYRLRPATPIGERYELVDDDREFAIVEAKGWWGWGTRRPVKMRVVTHDVDPGLLLFVAFVVRTLANKADSDASTTSVATNTGAYGG
jgi:hypothetical protein